MKYIIACSLLLVGCAAQRTAPARSEGVLPALPGGVRAALYEPSFVFAHESEIGLSRSQDADLRARVNKTQTRWDVIAAKLAAETHQLEVVLDASHIDEGKAHAKAADVIALESELKQTHLSLLIRIKNSLSRVQRRRLDAIRRRSAAR